LLAGPAFAKAPAIPTYGFEVVRSYPHDSNAFTQGLFFKNGVMFEEDRVFKHPFSLPSAPGEALDTH